MNNERITSGRTRVTLGPLTAAIGIALAALGSTPVRADKPETQYRENLEEVWVLGERWNDYLEDDMSSSLYTADLLDTARTINIINSTLIREQNAVSLSDVLTNVPGISMQAGEGGTPAGDQLSIRGFSARSDIFIDGVRDFGGYARDTYLIDRVEIAKGPGSNYTGRGSTGGSINMVTKTATSQDFMIGSASLGNAEYARATVDWNQTLNEQSAFRINLLAHHNEVPGRDEVENTRFGFAPAITFGLGTDTRYLFMYSYLYQDNTPDYGIPWVPVTNTAIPEYRGQVPPVDRSNWYGMTERDYEKIGNSLATARFEHDFSDSVTLSSQFRWGNTDRDSLITAPRFISNTSTDIRRTDWKSRDQQDRILNNMTALMADFTTGSLLHSLVAGFELSDEYEINYARDITGNQPVTDLYHPTPDDYWGGTIFRTGASTRSEGFSTSLFLADTVALSEQWLVSAGLRWDRFHLDFTNTLADGTIQNFERTDAEPSFQGNVVYKPSPNGSIYVGYGNSFNPSGEDLTLIARGGDLEEIEPETSNSFELGTKWELMDERLLLTGALFHTEKTNAREADPVDTTLTISSGKQEVEGVEFGLVGQLTDRWNLMTGYTYMQSEVKETANPLIAGNDLANTPRNTFSLWTTYQLTPQLLLGGGAQFVGDRYSSTLNDRKAPSYTLFNAVLIWQMNPNYALRLNATNLTDEEYLANVGGGHVIPGDGLGVIVSLDVTL